MLDSADEQAPGTGLLLEMTLETERLVSLRQQLVID